MRFTSILLISFLLINSNTFGQTRIITGKIIDESLDVTPYAIIKNSDTILFGKADINGAFKIEVPINIKTLIIASVGYERTIINLTPNCDNVEVILLQSASYDFMSIKKVDKLRMKQFKKLPALHLTAHKKGIFITEKPCYEETFVYWKKNK